MLKKYLSLFFTALILFISLNFIFSNLRAEDNKFTPICEITNIKVTCVNFNPNEIFKINLLSMPYRIKIEFENKKVIKNLIDNSEFVKNVRSNKSSKSNTKLVIEFKKPTIISNIKYFKNKNQSINLSLFYSDTSIANYAIAKHVLLKNKGNIFALENDINISSSNIDSKATKVVLPKVKKQNFKKIKTKEKYIVFIDPGHGGKDPGAIGQLGTLEKDITLKTSIMLEKELRKYKKILPVLSRNKDIYLSLRKRTMLAKKNKADIFISIHADSSKNKKASGISVFSLSDKASDEEAQILAQKENEVDDILGNNEKIEDPLIFGTLIKMYQREAMNDSSFLAKNILLNLEKTKLAVNRGHRFAGFSVLKSYNLPSVLIEIGFLSNKQEEKKLLNSKYLNELSKGLAVAIQNYFNNY